MNPSRVLRGGAIALGICLSISGMMGRAWGEEPIPVELPEEVKLTTPRMPVELKGSMRTINETLSKDVKPIDNGVVWLLQAVGGECIEQKLRKQTFEMLGIEALSEKYSRLMKIEDFSAARKIAGNDIMKDGREFGGGMNAGTMSIWTRDKYGAFADYLDQNSEALELIAAAVKRPQYYMPLVCDEEPQRIISASYGLELRLLFAAKLVVARAFLRMGEENIEGAMEDLLTCHRLASLMSRGSPFDVTTAKGGMIDAFAYNGEQVLLESGKVTAEQAKQYLKELAAVPPMLPAAEIADRGERAIIQQEIELIGEDQDDLRSLFEVEKEEDEKKEGKDGEKSEDPKPLPEIKWDLAVARGHEIQDKIVAALREQELTKQREMFGAIDKEYAKWDEEGDSITAKVVEGLEKRKDLDGASRYLGEAMARALRPNYRQRQATEDRGTVRRDLSLLGFALVAYQREKGEFPAELGGIVPEYLEKVPLDPQSGKAYFYERESKESARLVSWGANREDDAGRVPNDDQIFKLK